MKQVLDHYFMGEIDYDEILLWMIVNVPEYRKKHNTIIDLYKDSPSLIVESIKWTEKYNMIRSVNERLSDVIDL